MICGTPAALPPTVLILLPKTLIHMRCYGRHEDLEQTATPASLLREWLRQAGREKVLLQLDYSTVNNGSLPSIHLSSSLYALPRCRAGPRCRECERNPGRIQKGRRRNFHDKNAAQKLSSKLDATLQGPFSPRATLSNSRRDGAATRSTSPTATGAGHEDADGRDVCWWCKWVAERETGGRGRR